MLLANKDHCLDYGGQILGGLDQIGFLGKTELSQMSFHHAKKCKNMQNSESYEAWEVLLS